MLAVKPLFGDIAAFNPFPWLAAALLPVAAALVIIRRRLAAATKESQVVGIRQFAAPTKGGYVGLLLGVMASAILLTALPLIPGVAGMLAGLGVLGKFLLHLSVALALPMAGYFTDRTLRRRADKTSK